MSKPAFQDDKYHTETKTGVYLYSGTPGDFHEWEFRTKAKALATKEEDRHLCGPRVLEGLKGDAYLVARDLGLDALAKKDGIDQLVVKMREHVFPSLEDEAQLLYHHGQKVDGILARQSGESMFSYVSRRRRWWDTLKQLDDKTVISENIRSDLLLSMSGLDYDKQLLIKTTVGNRKDFDEIAKALIKQHPRVHMKERRYGGNERKPFTPGKGKGKSYSSEQRPKNWGHKPKHFAHLADYDVSDEADPAMPDESDDENVGFMAGDDDDEETAEGIPMDVMTAFIASNGDWSDEVAEVCSDQIQCELMAFFARGKSKGKGVPFQPRKPMQFKGRRNIPSLEDRRERLKALKLKSKCKSCGKVGHWAGDSECKDAKDKTVHLHLTRRGACSVPVPQDIAEMIAHPTVASSEDSSDGNYVAAYGHIDESDSDDEEPINDQVAMMHTEEAHEGGYVFPDAQPLEPPEGHDRKFTFGQYRSWTYLEVLVQQPRYVVWALAEPSPNPLFLGHFVCWVNTYYSHDSNTNTFRQKRVPTPIPTGTVPAARGRNKTKLSQIRKDPNGPCPGGCRAESGTHTGSNATHRRFTCYKCGYSTQTPIVEEPPMNDPSHCPHVNTDHRGSTKTVHRTYCKDCKQVVEEMPQESWRERQGLGRAAESASHHTAQVAARAIISENIVVSVAQARQIAALAQRLMERTILQAEASGVMVPATALLSATEDAIDAVTQAPQAEGGAQAFMAVLEDDIPDVLASDSDDDDDDVSTSVASDDADESDDSSDGYYPRGIVIDDPEELDSCAFSLTPDSGPADLPWVNIFEDEDVWAVLDEGCNSTCHGTRWAEDAEKKFNKKGWKCPWVHHRGKEYSGVGNETTIGKRNWPFAFEITPSTLRIPGTLASHQLPNEYAPLLLSGVAQGRLGLVKNTRTGEVTLEDYPDQKVQLYRDTGTRLTCINISRFPKDETPEALKDMVIDEGPQDDEPSPASPYSPEDHVAYMKSSSAAEWLTPRPPAIAPSPAQARAVKADVLRTEAQCMNKKLTIITIGLEKLEFGDNSERKAMQSQKRFLIPRRLTSRTRNTSRSSRSP